MVKKNADGGIKGERGFEMGRGGLENFIKKTRRSRRLKEM